MLNAIIKGFDGNRCYPWLLVKQTAKTATVQRCDVDGAPRGKVVSKRIDYTTGKPTVDVNAFETVYLSERYRGA